MENLKESHMKHALVAFLILMSGCGAQTVSPGQYSNQSASLSKMTEVGFYVSIQKKGINSPVRERLVTFSPVNEEEYEKQFIADGLIEPPLDPNKNGKQAIESRDKKLQSLIEQKKQSINDNRERKNSRTNLDGRGSISLEPGTWYVTAHSFDTDPVVMWKNHKIEVKEAMSIELNNDNAWSVTFL